MRKDSLSAGLAGRGSRGMRICKDTKKLKNIQTAFMRMKHFLAKCVDD